MRLLSLIYGVPFEVIYKMVKDGILTFSAVEYANIFEHYYEQKTLYKSKGLKVMDAVYDTMLHFKCDIAKVYRAKARYETYADLL
jgi:hypothetical protein